jgi:hypothetical protein
VLTQIPQPELPRRSLVTRAAPVGHRQATVLTWSAKAGGLALLMLGAGIAVLRVGVRHSGRAED